MTEPAARPIEIDDLFNITLVSDPALSPDGRRCAWVETHLDKDDDTYKAAIWVSEANGDNARQLTSGSWRDTDPQWSPDGHEIVFVSNRTGQQAKPNGDDASSKPSTQLWIIDVDGGEAIQLTTHPKGASSPSWSPDGRNIAFVATDVVGAEDTFDAPVTVGVHADEIVVNDIRYRFNGKGFLETFSHIWAIDVASKEAAQITFGDVNDAEPRWSPDGRSIAFVGNRRDDRRRLAANTIQLVSANGGDVRTLAPDNAMFGSPTWSPDGKKIAFTGHEDAKSGLGRNDAVWTVSATGSRLKNHTAKVDIAFSDAGMSDVSTGNGWSPRWLDDDSLLVLGSSRGATQIYQVPVSKGKPVAITGDQERVTQFDATAGGKQVVFVSGAADRPFELKSASTKGKRLSTIRNPNAALTDRIHLAAPVEMDVTAPDGGAVQAWILPPHGLDPEGKVKYPLILQIHGGPHAMYGHGMFHEMQVMAARGYGVVFCNPRGSSGYGESFTTCTRGTWGESDMPDIMAAVDAAVKLPWVDSERLGITGGSYGGFMTNWIIGHDQRFKAAVTQRCVSNHHSFVGTSDIGFDFGIHQFEGTPWSDAEKLLRYSPISYVDQITTPLLIIHGEKDLRCPIEQAEQMFTALKYLDKEVAFVRVPDESHELSRSGTPSRRIARLRHLIGWFDNHL